MYLSIIGECTYPVLQAYMQYVITCDPTGWLMKAIENGNLELLQYTVAIGGLRVLDWERCMIRATAYAQLDIIQYTATQILCRLSGSLMSSKSIDVWNKCMTVASCAGHIGIVQYAVKQLNPRFIDWNGCIYWAALGGRIEIIQYAVSTKLEFERSNNYVNQKSVNWDVCMAEGALGGHLEIVRHAASQGTPGTLNYDWSIHQARYNEKRNREIIDFLEQCKYQSMSRTHENKNEN